MAEIVARLKIHEHIEFENPFRFYLNYSYEKSFDTVPRIGETILIRNTDFINLEDSLNNTNYFDYKKIFISDNYPFEYEYIVKDVKYQNRAFSSLTYVEIEIAPKEEMVKKWNDTNVNSKFIEALKLYIGDKKKELELSKNKKEKSQRRKETLKKIFSLGLYTKK